MAGRVVTRQPAPANFLLSTLVHTDHLDCDRKNRQGRKAHLLVDAMQGKALGRLLPMRPVPHQSGMKARKGDAPFFRSRKARGPSKASVEN